MFFTKGEEALILNLPKGWESCSFHSTPRTMNIPLNMAVLEELQKVENTKFPFWMFQKQASFRK